MIQNRLFSEYKVQVHRETSRKGYRDFIVLFSSELLSWQELCQERGQRGVWSSMFWFSSVTNVFIYYSCINHDSLKHVHRLCDTIPLKRRDSISPSGVWAGLVTWFQEIECVRSNEMSLPGLDYKMTVACGFSLSVCLFLVTHFVVGPDVSRPIERSGWWRTQTCCQKPQE